MARGCKAANFANESGSLGLDFAFALPLPLPCVPFALLAASRSTVLGPRRSKSCGALLRAPTVCVRVKGVSNVQASPTHLQSRTSNDHVSLARSLGTLCKRLVHASGCIACRHLLALAFVLDASQGELLLLLAG